MGIAFEILSLDGTETEIHHNDPFILESFFRKTPLIVNFRKKPSSAKRV